MRLFGLSDGAAMCFIAAAHLERTARLPRLANRPLVREPVRWAS